MYAMSVNEIAELVISVSAFQ